MRLKKRNEQDTGDLSLARLYQIINTKHELVGLAEEIDWFWIEEQLASCAHGRALRPRQAVEAPTPAARVPAHSSRYELYRLGRKNVAGRCGQAPVAIQSVRLEFLWEGLQAALNPVLDSYS